MVNKHHMPAMVTPVSVGLGLKRERPNTDNSGSRQRGL
jgi:hypothetical protein